MPSDQTGLIKSCVTHICCVCYEYVPQLQVNSRAGVGPVWGMWMEDFLVAAGWRLLRGLVSLALTSLSAQCGRRQAPRQSRTLTELPPASHSGAKGKQSERRGFIKLLWSAVQFQLTWTTCADRHWVRYKEVSQKYCAERYRLTSVQYFCRFLFVILIVFFFCFFT